MTASLAVPEPQRLRWRDLLLATPLLGLGVVAVDTLDGVGGPGPLVWAAVGLSGGAIALYLALARRGED